MFIDHQGNLILAEETATEPTGGILKKYGLEFTVRKEQLYFKDDDRLRKTENYAIVRNDNSLPLGICKEAYKIVQNSEIYETLMTGIQGTDYNIKQAGYFDEGKKIYFLINTGEMQIGNDRTETSIFAKSSHDGSSSLMYCILLKVVSCENYFNRSISAIAKEVGKKGGQLFTMRHTDSIKSKHDEVKRQFQKIAESQKGYIEKLNRLANININDMLAEKLVKELLQTDKKQEISTRQSNIIADVESSIRKELREKGNTAWGLLNGITYYTNHKKSHPTRTNGRLEMVLDGSGNDMANKAYDYINKQLMLN